MTLYCPFCKCLQYNLGELNRYIRHLSIHSNQPNFAIRCGIESCEKNYTNYHAFRRHVRKKHGACFLKKSVENVMSPYLDDDAPLSENSPNRNDDEILEPNGPNLNQTLCNLSPQDKLDMFYLTLREKYNLPVATARNIFSDICTFINEWNSEASEADFPNFKRNVIIPNEISSDYMLANHMEKINMYVPPVEFVLCRTEIRPVTYQYVPIHKSLRQLISKPELFPHFVKQHFSQNDDLLDYCDGTNCREGFNIDPSGYPNIDIFIYVDEFQLANPLGSKTTMHKICGIYYSLGNIPPKLRSKVDIIQLMVLCKSVDLKKHGFPKVLENLITDLQDLQKNGLTVQFEDATHFFNIKLSVLIADNLGAHSVGGFLESFNAIRMCRFCMGKKTEIGHKFSEGEYVLRTEAGYNNQLLLLQGDPALSALYGIKRDCPLNGVAGFHIIGGSAPDVAHDLLEGVGPRVISKLLSEVIKTNRATIEVLNRMVKEFPYVNSDKTNKPSQFSIDSKKIVKIHQSFSQMWCLLRLFPLIFEALFEKDSQQWMLLTTFLDLLDVVLSPKQNNNSLAQMKSVINDFLEIYTEMHGTNSMTPKFHYLIHYPSATIKFGPLIHVWTMRFEAKHKFFKDRCKLTKNSKNLCKTLAVRHQLHQCYLNFSDDICRDTVCSTFCKPISLNEEQLNLLPSTIRGNAFSNAKSITMSGTMYCVGMALLWHASLGVYHFAIIDSILLTNGIPYFLLSVHASVYNINYHAYQLTDILKKQSIQSSTLPFYLPLNVYKLHGESVIVLKYRIDF